MHLTEGGIQAYLDGELSREEVERTKQHLLGCEICRESLAQIQKRVETNRSLFEPLAPEQMPEQAVLLQQLHSKRKDEALPRASKWKHLSAAVLVIAALVASLNFKPVRVWASDFLSLFRVQQITVLRFDPANLKQMEQGLFGGESERRIEQFLSDNAHINKRGEAQIVQSVNDAARIAGFGVQLPSSLQPTRIRVHPPVDASFDIDVERLQGILDDAGRSDIQIPEEIDGDTIQFNVPASVTASFGNCPDPQQSEANESEPNGRSSDQYKDCKILVQLPAPVMVAPPTLNVTEIGAQLLKLLGFTEEQARNFSESVDWATTLVVPLPVDPRMTVQEVDIHGVKGHLFVTREGRDEPPSFNVLWLRDGILYSFLGRGTADEALAIANSI